QREGLRFVVESCVDAAVAADQHRIEYAAERVRRARGELVGDCIDLFVELFRRHDPVDESECERARSVDRRTEQAKLQRGTASGQAQQTLGAAESRKEPEVDFRLPQL